jgi:hypothetical protein
MEIATISKRERARITADNVNDILMENGYEGEIDLLCLDLDGIDYWIWKSLQVVQPRVVVVEYNNLWGSDDAVTIPYSDGFEAVSTADGPNYSGASLAAFVSLAKARGYRLIGCERLSFNAFFMRADVGTSAFPEVSVDSCLQHSFAKRSRRDRLPTVKEMPWIRV